MNELGHGPWEKDYKPSGIKSNLPIDEAIYEHGFNQGYEQAKKDINKEMMDRMEKYKEMQEKALLADHNYSIYIEQAEKDLALTIEDLELLHTFLYAVKNNKQGAFTFTRLSDEQYQEVLKRFNKAKK